MSAWDQWLCDNVHFGSTRLGVVSGISRKTLSDDLSRLGLNIRLARRERGLPEYSVPGGDIPKAPARTTSAAIASDAPAEEVDVEARNKHLRSENKRLQAALVKATTSHGETLEALDGLFAAMEVVSALPPIPPLHISASTEKPTVIAKLSLGDWHTGEILSLIHI